MILKHSLTSQKWFDATVCEFHQEIHEKNVNTCAMFSKIIFSNFLGLFLIARFMNTDLEELEATSSLPYT